MKVGWLHVHISAYLWKHFGCNLILIMTLSAFHEHACQSYIKSNFYLSFYLQQETMIKYNIRHPTQVNVDITINYEAAAVISALAGSTVINDE